MTNNKKYDERHGGPYDRGSADAYYRRGIDPHYYPGRSYVGTRIEKDQMTDDEIEAYMAGYYDQEDFKDWG